MPNQKDPPARRPSQVFADRMREVRERKRWTQQDLADRLGEMGEPTDRATIARTETRARGLSLDDAMAYAAALGASFTDMVCHDREAAIALAPKFVVPGWKVRHWFRGNDALRPEDHRTLVMEGPADEWMARQHVYLNVLVDRVQRLIEAWGDDDRERATELIEQEINPALERLLKEVTDRGAH